VDHGDVDGDPSSTPSIMQPTGHVAASDVVVPSERMMAELTAIEAPSGAQLNPSPQRIVAISSSRPSLMT
jgi:hypothetical protein